MKEFISSEGFLTEYEKKKKALGILMAKCEKLQAEIAGLLAKRRGLQAGILANELERLIETMEGIKTDKSLEAGIVDRILNEEEAVLEVEEVVMDESFILERNIQVVDVVLPKKFKVAGIKEDEFTELISDDDADVAEDEAENSQAKGLSGVIDLKNGISNVDYGGSKVQVILKVEGEDGLIVGTVESTDEYRGHFGRWYRIRGLTEVIEVIADLGRGLSLFSKYKRFGENDCDESHVNTINTEKGEIIYGTNNSTEYYPRGFLRVEWWE